MSNTMTVDEQVKEMSKTKRKGNIAKRVIPPMPPMKEGETDDQYTDRMTESELAAAWNNQAQTVLQLQRELKDTRDELEVYRLASETAVYEASQFDRGLFLSGDRGVEGVMRRVLEALKVARSEATQAKAQAAFVAAERDTLRQELAEARGYINNRFVDECAWCGKQFSPHEHTLATEHTGHCEQNPIIKERDAARQSRARLLGYLYSIDEILPPMPASNPFYRTILGRVRLLKDQLRYLEQKP